MKSRFVRGVALAPFAFALACHHHADAPEPATDCRVVGTNVTDEQLATLARTSASPLLRIGDDVLVCACGARRFGGATENAKLGGDTERAHLGGATEIDRTGGNGEAAHVGGAVEGSHLGGAREQGKLGGDKEPLTCREVEDCDGFVVSGEAPLRVYDGRVWKPLAGRCVSN